MVKGKGKIKVVVTGAGGRMGTRLVTLIKESPNLELVGAVEGKGHPAVGADAGETAGCGRLGERVTDRKSTRLNSSHSQISYAVFCLKKKTTTRADKTSNAVAMSIEMI